MTIDFTVERAAGGFIVRFGGQPSGLLPTQEDVRLYKRAVAIGHGFGPLSSPDERKRVVNRLASLGGAGYRFLSSMVECAPY
jgi:hypothetical protein